MQGLPDCLMEGLYRRGGEKVDRKKVLDRNPPGPENVCLNLPCVGQKSSGWLNIVNRQSRGEKWVDTLKFQLVKFGGGGATWLEQRRGGGTLFVG